MYVSPMNSPIATRRDVITTSAATLVGLCFPAVGDEPRPTTKGAKEVSERGIALIKEFEGLRLQAYKCPAGVWTIGYGHTREVTEQSILKDKDAAKRLLLSDLEPHRREVLEVFKNVPLTQCQLDALVSARFNVNCLEVRKESLREHLLRELPRLNEEHVKDAHANDARAEIEVELVSHLCRYNKAARKFLPGLLRRRLSEGLLLTGREVYIVKPEQFDYYVAMAKAELKKQGKTSIATSDESCIKAMVRIALQDRAK